MILDRVAYEIDQHDATFFPSPGAPRRCDGEHAIVHIDRPHVAYTATTAHTAATELLDYAHRLDHGGPLPDNIVFDVVDPDIRTATTTTWDLGDGLTLRYTAPLTATLTADYSPVTLTASLATLWARALMTVALELDEAHAVALRAIVGQRIGRAPARAIRSHLDNLAAEHPGGGNDLATQIRAVLDEDDRVARRVELLTAIDLDHPDLPAPVTNLATLPRSGATHEDAARVIAELADRYALPHYVWSASNRFITDELGDIALTEHQWERFARSTAIRDFAAWMEDTQESGPVLDIRAGLEQAGILCRTCGAALTEDVRTTVGFREQHRPRDPDEALAMALNTRCPGSDSPWHDANSAGECGVCGLPITPVYALFVDTAVRASREKLDAKKKADEAIWHEAEELAATLMRDDVDAVTRHWGAPGSITLTAQQHQIMDEIDRVATERSVDERTHLAELLLRSRPGPYWAQARKLITDRDPGAVDRSATNIDSEADRP
ncbi:hypothetical protein [Amycolatopsis sp. CA-230715]|uniref:hypothetical protein n=1 Tax=Amycolatopsis sp. CA-230715 TaxID=2745196 RepID=UPI001C038F7D|nr:hypothetical protein [Amycolatopsis sp. CA-230715]